MYLHGLFMRNSFWILWRNVPKFIVILLVYELWDVFAELIANVDILCIMNS